MKRALAILVLILILAVAGTGTGLYLVWSKLSSTQSELQLAQAAISDQQTRIENQNSQINDLQSQITLKDAEMNDVQARFTETKSILEQTISEKDELTLTLNNYKDGYNNTKLQLATVNQELEDAQSKIQLMKDTFGDVNAGIIPPHEYITNGTVMNRNRLFNLKRNPDVVDPTWNQLVKFLGSDDTDGNPYVEDLYTCGNYAEDVFNNAEAVGIRAAVVCLSFEDEAVGHALNAFKTTDRGLVYIDCTGEPAGTPHPGMDTIADVELGEYYQRDFIFPCNYYFDPWGKITSVSIFW